MGHLIHTYNVLPSSSPALLFHNPHSFMHFFNPCGWLSYLNNRPRCWILPTAKAHRNFVRRARHSFTQSPHQVFCCPGCVLRRIAPKDSSPSITHVLLSTWTFWWDNSRVHFTHSLNHSLTVLKFTRSSLVVSRKGCIAPRQVATSSRSFNCPQFDLHTLAIWLAKFDLQFLEAPGIGQHDPGEAPHLLCGIFQRSRWLALEEVHVRQEVVRTPATLQAWDQLQEDSIDAVRYRRLLPLGLARMLFALVQQQGLQMVRGDWVSGQVQVAVTERLQDTQTSPAEPSWKRK